MRYIQYAVEFAVFFALYMTAFALLHPTGETHFIYYNF